MIHLTGRPAVQALLAVLYPCPNSPSGQHRTYTPEGLCIYCKGRREPGEAEEGSALVPGRAQGNTVARPPSPRGGPPAHASGVQE